MGKISFVPYKSGVAVSPAVKSLQSCPTLCDPIDVSPRGSPVPGILQARTLEWVAISFSSAGKWKVRVKSLSLVRLLATPRTAAHQAPSSMGFSRQEYWSGLPLPSPTVSPSPAEILSSSPIGLQSQTPWGLLVLLPDPQAVKPDMGLSIFTTGGELLSCYCFPVYGSPTWQVWDLILFLWHPSCLPSPSFSLVFGQACVLICLVGLQGDPTGPS